MTDWYYSDAQRTQHGPVSASDLAALHGRGQLPPDTLVWREGMSAWRPWREMLREVIAGGMPEDPQAEAFVKAAEAAPADGAYRPYAIAEPTPYAPPQARIEDRAAPVHGGHVVYARFWKRFAASVIDNCLLGIIGGVLGAMVGIGRLGAGNYSTAYSTADAVLQIVSLLIGGCYFGAMYASSSQASLGKMAVGIKVVRTDGTPITFWRGFGRYFATLLSTFTLMIGYLMAAFTARKQALHDMVCDTLVVDKYAYTDQPELQSEELGTVTIVILILFGLMMLGLLALIVVAGVALTSMIGGH